MHVWVDFHCIYTVGVMFQMCQVEKINNFAEQLGLKSYTHNMQKIYLMLHIISINDSYICNQTPKLVLRRH